MKEFKIEFSINARQDMKTINFYLENVLFNSRASHYFSKGIENTVDNLKQFPYLGTIYLNYKNRYLIYKNFYIFYEIQEKEKIINIKRIIHKNKIVF